MLKCRRTSLKLILKPITTCFWYSDWLWGGQWRKSGLIPGRCRRLFFSLKWVNHFWGMATLPVNGYQGLLSGGKLIWAWSWPFTPHLVPKIRISEATPLVPHTPLWLAWGQLYLYCCIFQSHYTSSVIAYTGQCMPDIMHMKWKQWGRVFAYVLWIHGVKVNILTFHDTRCYLNHCTLPVLKTPHSVTTLLLE